MVAHEGDRIVDCGATDVRCSIDDVAAIHPLDLDYATRRFVALASVLAVKPKIILLDEPQRGLDKVWTDRLEHVIAGERAGGNAVILISHDMNFVLRNAGTVLALGVSDPVALPADEFFANRDLLRHASVDVPALTLVRQYIGQAAFAC